MTEPTFRRIFGVDQGYFTDLAATVRNINECPTIAEKITALLPDSRPILREEILRTYTSLFDWRSGYVIVLLAGAVLAFLIFAWDKATGLTAEERSEIGILKALGWDTGDVLLLKFWEGMVVCLTAFLIGVRCRIRARFSGGCTPVRARPEGLGGTVPFLRADTGFRCLSAGGGIRPDGGALHADHDRPGLARGGHGPGCGHAIG